jgi:riboflavin kinase/FMN adenylyltransferase
MPGHPLSWLFGEARRVPRAITIGVFDGVHRGHQELVHQLRTTADERGLVPTVLTFEPHPLAVVASDKAPERLMTTAYRLRLLGESGAAAAAALLFDRALAALTPDEFVRDVLVGLLDTRAVVASAAFRFGAGARGDIAALRRIGGEFGIDVIEVPPLLHDGRRVSSTRVRAALRDGDAAGAATLLGRPHRVEGIVERGLARGRTLGFPTANLGRIGVMLPAEGIYAAWARWDGELRPAAVHVGRRLTFEGASTVEAHLLDAQVELYDRPLALDFAARLRDDVRFAGPDELAAQIALDVAQVRALLGGAPGTAAAAERA